MRTATQYIKDRTGRFQGSISLRPPVLAVPQIPTKPAVPEDVSESNNADFLARWDLASADKDLYRTVEYSSVKQQNRMKALGLLTFIGINAAYVSTVIPLVSSSLPAPVIAGLTLLSLPVAFAMASLGAMQYKQAKNGIVVER